MSKISRRLGAIGSIDLTIASLSYDLRIQPIEGDAVAIEALFIPSSQT